MRAVPAGDLTPLAVEYVQSKTGAPLDVNLSQAFLVVNKNNDMVAAVVISNFRDIDCEISCASETGAAWRPHVCETIFSYIFNQLKCIRVTCITTKNNRKARSFLESLGFQLEGNLRRGYDGKNDALIYGLLAEECRFLKRSNEATDGQEKRT